jgi:hypothetical protein
MRPLVRRHQFRSPTRCGGQLCRPRVQRCADQPVMALAPCLARRTGADRATACVWRFCIQLLCHANSSSSLTWRSCARSSGGLSAEQATAVPTAQEPTAPAHLAAPRHTGRACAGAERTRAAVDDPGGLAAQAVPATAGTSPACDAAPRLPYLPHSLRRRGDPSAPVPAGEGSLSRTDLVAAPSTAASCVTGNTVAGRWVWRRQPAGATGRAAPAVRA